MANQPFPGEDIIDSRDIIAWIEEVEGEIESLNDENESLMSDCATHEAQIESLEDEIEQLNEGDREDVEDMIAEREDEINKLREEIEDAEREIDDNRDEIETLEEDLKPYTDLQDDAEGYAADWRYGEALILDDYFVEYARQMAYDIGAVDGDANWPANHIDWDAAADELKMDYTSVEFAGYEYWIR